MNGNDLALRPLRHFADFSGRSTRGELFNFALFVAVLGVPAVVADFFFGWRSSGWMMWGLMILLACPIAAMLVRRVHDVGLSGWWILPLAPILGVGWWNELQRLLNPFVYPPPRLPLPHVVEVAGSLLAMAAFILLFWGDEEAANRYGPNPRTGPVGEVA